MILITTIFNFTVNTSVDHKHYSRSCNELHRIKVDMFGLKDRHTVFSIKKIKYQINTFSPLLNFKIDIHYAFGINLIIVATTELFRSKEGIISLVIKRAVLKIVKVKL